MWIREPSTGPTIPATARAVAATFTETAVASPRRMTFDVLLAKAKAWGIPDSPPFARTTSADSMAASVPMPMAIPTDAALSAAASLTPSPIMQTALPSASALLT